MTKKDAFMSLPIVTKISSERVEDVLCSAIEGGSNYWATFTFSKAVDIIKDGYFKCVEDGIVTVNDREENKDYPLTIESLKQGLKVIGEKYTWHLNAIINEEDDADTADAFLQCCLFGDIVYG